MPIQCMETEIHSRGIDTEEDLKAVAQLLMTAER